MKNFSYEINVNKKLMIKECDQYLINQIIKMMEYFSEIDIKCEIKEKINYFPENITHLTLHKYNFPVDNLPTNLKYLSLVNNYSHPLNNLPNGLEILIFQNTESYYRTGIRFSQTLENLPENLKILYLSDNYVGSSLNFPVRLKEIAIQGNISFDLSELPQGVEKVVFGQLVKIPIINLNLSIKELVIYNSSGLINLPDNLEKLTIYNSHTNVIKYFPPNLKSIIFYSHSYKQDYSILPTGLESLELHYSGFNDFKFKLPPNLKKFAMSSVFGKRNSFDIFPDSIEHLEVINEHGLPMNKLPSNLKCFIIKGKFNSPIDFSSYPLYKLDITGNFDQPIDNLPCTLKILNILGIFNHPINNLPPNLKRLLINSKFNHPIDSLPLSLTSLGITGASFNQPVDKLPPNLEELLINQSKFSFPVDNLPDSIRVLVLYTGCFNHPIHNLPSNLESLSIGGIFNQPINNLPSKLKNLIVSGEFNQCMISLPSSLEQMYLCRSYNQHPSNIILPQNVKFLSVDKDYQYLKLLLEMYPNVFISIR